MGQVKVVVVLYEPQLLPPDRYTPTGVPTQSPQLVPVQLRVEDGTVSPEQKELLTTILAAPLHV